MPMYDPYEAYRSPALSEQELALLDGAGSDRAARTSAHIRIACARARKQFSSWPLLPEDPNLSVRFPGVDPLGKQSVIDMKLAYRRALLSARLQTCSAQARSFPERVRHDAGAGLEKLRQTLAADAGDHRLYTRASKLCLDAEGRQQLHIKARALESGPAAVACSLYFLGLEYAAGLREGPVLPDVAGFFADTLGFPLTPSVLDAGKDFHRPERLTVSFYDFNHRLLQLRFSDPKSWGKSPADPELPPLDGDAIAVALPPYVTTAVRPVLDAAFRFADRGGLCRADLLRVGGRTVRERLEQEVMQDPSGQQLRNQSHLCVAAALMAGKQVDAFLPGPDGTIPEKPVPIVREGYTPAAQDKPVHIAWEQFCVRQGFCP